MHNNLNVGALWAEVTKKYVHVDHNHALAILTQAYPALFSEVCQALLAFSFTNADIIAPGGSESEVTKLFKRKMVKGWCPDALKVNGKTSHEVDFIKDKVALDFEWNSKDQTFDRDLNAFRTFKDHKRIAVGIIVTRATNLQEHFQTLGTFTDKQGNKKAVQDKYGASTTHLDKLIQKLEMAGHCPVLGIGITTNCIK